MTRPRFGIISTFGDLRNAEYENIERIRLTAAEIGCDCHVLDVLGRPLDPAVDPAIVEQLDFVISLHFKTPKCYDAYTYVALWNPIRFYHQWGYERYAHNLLSYDDFLSCSSSDADDHVRRLIAFDPSRLPPALTLYHSLSSPVLPVTEGARRLFYCGVNWERLSGTHGRHHDCFKQLDASGVVDFYGPERLGQVRPWEGFASYRGELPFDGVSLVHAIHECGAALVLSSEAHKESGLMSNRLFEACAAGALIIADENPFVARFFGDAALYVDGSAPPESLADQILARLSWANEHPADAAALARRSQAIFEQRFSLRRSLGDLVAQHPARRAAVRAAACARQTGRVLCIAVALDPRKEDLERIVAGLRRQTFGSVDLALVVDEARFEPLREWFEPLSEGLSCQLVAVRGLCSPQPQRLTDPGAEIRVGPAIARLLDESRSDYFCVMFQHEELYADHFSLLARKLEDTPDASWCAADYLVERSTGGAQVDCELRSARIDGVLMLDPHRDFCSARVLFRARAWRPELAMWLNGIDVHVTRFLVQANDRQAICYSHRPTVVVRAATRSTRRRSHAAADYQVCRDYVLGRELAGHPVASAAQWTLRMDWSHPPAANRPSTPPRPTRVAPRRIARRMYGLFRPQQKIVVFGAGQAGRNVLGSLPLRLRVVAFADNDRTKHGNKVSGIPIVPPTVLKTLDAARVVVASIHAGDIVEQLLADGIAPDRIAVAPPEATTGGSCSWDSLLASA